MAWTTPRTWVDGELVTAAIMNLHVRDNFNASGMHLVARKTSDESRTSDTAFSDDDFLQLPVGTNEHWFVNFAVWYSGNTSGNIKIQFTFPTGGTIGLATPGYNAAGTMDYGRFTGTTSPSTSNNFVCVGSNGRTYLSIEGMYVNGGTSGTVIMQWAQNASNATPTVVHTDSAIWGMKLA